MTFEADIAVHGSGITAHTTALLMAGLGLRVQVTAVPSSSHTAAVRDIRAYAVNHASKATLTLAGAWPDDTHADWLTPVHQMRVFGDTSGQLDFNSPDGMTNLPVAWMADVPALENTLRRLVSTHSRITPVAKGAEPEGTLNVLCEGKHSAWRSRLGIDTAPVHYPHRALAARLRSAQPHGGVAQQWFDGNTILALLPVGGAGGCDLAMVWSMPQAQCDEWTRKSETADGVRELLQAIGTASRHGFSQLEILSGPVGFGLTRSLATQWVLPGVALVGDSAHTIHPLAGLGLNMGLADVQALLDVVGARRKGQTVADMRVLRRYQRSRAASTADLQFATHTLFHLFTQPWAKTQPVQSLRNWGMLAVNAAKPLKRWVQAQGMGRTY